MGTEELTKQLDYMVSEITDNSLANQRCDFTGWNLTEAIVNIGLELKRYNDMQETK